MAVGLWLDLILVAFAVEAALLTVWLSRRRPQMRRGVLANLAAGGALLLAVRGAVAGQGIVVLALLTVALVAHVADLYLRLR